jgi:hypothetical protein
LPAKNFRPSRVFAAEAVRPPAEAPPALTAGARRGLRGAERTARIEAELAYLHRLYVPSPTQQACADAILEHVEAARWALPGAFDSLYILGAPGTGKSSAVRDAALRYHRARLDGAGQTGNPDPRLQQAGYVSDMVPAIMMTVRAEAKNKAFVSQIVNFLGYEEANSTATALADRIPELAQRHGVGLVIADDVRNLADLGRDRDAVHNTIKNINTELGFLNVCSVYVGNPDDNGIGNLFTNAQLNQRLIPFPFHDMHFDMDTSEPTLANMMWWEYLADWESALRPLLPDMEPHTLSSTLGRRLWKRSQGSVGGLSGLLKRASVDQLRSAWKKHQRLTLTKERIMETPMPMRFKAR